MSSELIHRMFGAAAPACADSRPARKANRRSMIQSIQTWPSRLESRSGARRVAPFPVLCPFCENRKDKVIDSRMSKAGDVIRRRRHCMTCGRRFTTYERIDDIPYMVVKKDDRRERFDRRKVLRGLLRACEKRPVSMAQMQGMVSAAEMLATESDDRECTTRSIGELLMRELEKVDRVAYVRFASVYLDFQHEQEFLDEVRELLQRKAERPPAEGPA